MFMKPSQIIAAERQRRKERESRTRATNAYEMAAKRAPLKHDAIKETKKPEEGAF